MKRILILAIAMLLIAGVAYAGILNSKHDMRSSLTASVPTGGYNEICVYCHTPHNAATTSTTSPLWNRSVTTAATYIPYTSSTMNNTMDATLGPQSNACMTCHDGTLSVNALKNTPLGTAGQGDNAPLTAAGLIVAGDTNFGSDLSNDHPVGITFSNTDDSGLYTLAEVQAKTTQVRLFGSSTNQVECASCHNVHNPGLTSDGTAPFLKSTNTASALCLACHNK